jgi:hypothetical protein
VLSAAAHELSELPASVHRLTGAELDAVLPVVDALTTIAAAGRFTIAAEAEERGEVTASQAGSRWPPDALSRRSGGSCYPSLSQTHMTRW